MSIDSDIKWSVLEAERRRRLDVLVKACDDLALQLDRSAAYHWLVPRWLYRLARAACCASGRHQERGFAGTVRCIWCGRASEVSKRASL